MNKPDMVLADVVPVDADADLSPPRLNGVDLLPPRVNAGVGFEAG